MSRIPFAAALVCLTAVALCCTPANAFFHAWTFSEFFSSADGSVQFIEMVTSLSGETQSASAEIRTDSGNVFDFPGNLSGSTLNKRVLIATAGFAALPGAVTPDFTLPTTNFFNPAGDRIRLFHPSLGEFHTRTFSSVPTDGVMSLNYPAGSPLINSPQNFSGATGSVNLVPPAPTGDYNGNGAVDAADYVVWRDTLDSAVTPGQGADGDADGMIDDGDYDFWRARFGNTAPGAGLGTGSTAVPEPTAMILIATAIASLALCKRH